MTKSDFMAIPQGDLFVYDNGISTPEARYRIGECAFNTNGVKCGIVASDDGAKYYRRAIPGEFVTVSPGYTPEHAQQSPAMRGFETGATRSSDAGRYDPEGFLSPIALERFCEYMNKHRVQADGTLRDSDNWQKGMPLATYIKGMWRHFLHLWQRHRGWTVTDPKAAADVEEDLCAMWFNVQGMLHEIVKARRCSEGLDRRGERK